MCVCLCVRIEQLLEFHNPISKCREWEKEEKKKRHAQWGKHYCVLRSFLLKKIDRKKNIRWEQLQQCSAFHGWIESSFSVPDSWITTTEKKTRHYSVFISRARCCWHFFLWFDTTNCVYTNAWLSVNDNEWATDFILSKCYEIIHSFRCWFIHSRIFIFYHGKNGNEQFVCW